MLRQLASSVARARRFSLLLGLLALAGPMSARAVAQILPPIPFSGCGTLVPGANCLVFEADSGGTYQLEDYGTFQANDRVLVSGTIELLCLSPCELGAGCLFQNTISACATPAPVSFCFGDGSGTACPCGNVSPTPGTGCTNSVGVGGTLTRQGNASVGSDTLVLFGGGLPDGGAALYFQGTARVAGGNGAPFGDGLRCVGGTVTRLAVKASSGFGTVYPQGGDAPISVRGGVVAGDLRDYQIWYRNADPSFCTSATFNLTNALELTWTP